MSAAVLHVARMYAAIQQVVDAAVVCVLLVRISLFWIDWWRFAVF